MGRGRSWDRDQVRHWVEGWWDSGGLTSEEFVWALNLPIAPRSLREHGQRLFAEVREELKQLRGAGAPEQVRPPATVTPVPDAMAEAAVLPPVEPRRVAPLAPEADQPVSIRGFFDFGDGDAE